MEDLAALIIRVKTGDSQAYNIIVRRFQDMAVGYGYAISGDFHLAEDAAQEAFLKAYQTISALRDPAAFPGWFRCIVFQQVDRLRRGKRIATVSLDVETQSASAQQDPSEVVEGQTIQAQVYEAITTLPEHHRQVITLFYINDYSHKEISDFLEIPIATVKTRLYNARKRLKERMIRMIQDNLFKHRPSKNETFAHDLQAMILLVKARPHRLISNFPSPVDLHELLAVADIRDKTHLWEDASGRVVAFAIAYIQYHQLIFELAPEMLDTELASQVIAWGVEQMQAAGLKEIKVNCRDHHRDRITLLERHGFMPQPVRTLHLRRNLSDPIAKPELPAGFTIRHVAGENEDEELVMLHRAAFGTEHMTVEYRLAMMRVPEYDPTLDLLVVAPDGALAAYCNSNISLEENGLSGLNEGWIGVIGTHPDYQRRGLARALMLTCFDLMKQRGMDSVGTSTWGENSAMKAAAKSVGFQVEAETIFFQKFV